MAIVYDNEIPNIQESWEHYRGSRVEEFIKKMLNAKAGCFYPDSENSRVLVFADETSRDLYLQDPVTYASLRLGAFDAPSEYRGIITLWETQLVQYVKYGSTGHYIYADFKVVDRNDNPQAENATFTITVRNGTSVQKIIRNVAYGDRFTFLADDYLKEGTNLVSVAAMGNDTLAGASVSVTIYAVNLSLTDTMDISLIHGDGESERLRIPFHVVGMGTKYMEWFVDGVAVPRVDADDNVTGLDVERTKYIDIPGLTAGRHNLQFRCYMATNDGTRFYSDTIYRDFIVQDTVNTRDIIAAGFSIPTEFTPESGPTVDPMADPIRLPGVTQYLPTQIQYAIFSPKGNTEVDIEFEGKTRTLGAQSDYVYTYELTPSVVDQNSRLAFRLGATTLVFNVAVAASQYDLTEYPAHMVFSGDDRTNSSSNRDTWSFRNSAGTTIRGSLSGFQWNDRSGWAPEGLVIPSGASFSADYAPLDFAMTAGDGATIEFELETRRVLDDNAVVCDLRDAATGAGILLTASEALLTSGNTTVSAKYKSGESFRVSFVINPTSGTRTQGLVFIFINGILSGAVNYQGESFRSARKMVFSGSDDATIVLKQIRCYRSALSMEQILNNYILYRPTTEDLIRAYDRNDILMASTGQASSDKLAARTPIIIVTGNVEKIQNFTPSQKSQYVRMDKIEIINLDDPTKNLTITDASMRGQGTSSMSYPRKNFRFYLQADGKDKEVDPYVTRVFDYKGDELTGSDRLYAFKNGAQPVHTWCLKADYAESSSTHNTGIARLWNNVLKNATVEDTAERWNKYYLPKRNDCSGSRTPGKTIAQHCAEKNRYPYDVRTTVDGFPITLFYHMTENDPLIFLGRYNWNNDKSTESVFGFRDIDGFDNTNVECWETVNGNFVINQFIDYSKWDATDDDGWAHSFESRYPDDAGSASEANRASGTNGGSGALKALVVWLTGTRRRLQTAWGDKYDYDGDTRFPLTGMSQATAALRKNEFAAEKWNHLDVYKVAAYYVYLMRFGGVDQTVKNAMLTTEDGQHWFFINYDNDTINGLSNDGALSYGYDIDRRTQVDGLEGTYCYAGYDSTLWNNCENDAEFMEIVKVMDRALFKAGLTYPNVIRMFNDEQSGKWAERTHNLDYDFKYLTIWLDRGDNQLPKLQGPRRTHREWWLSHRFAIYDAMNMTDQFTQDMVWIKPETMGPAMTGDLVKVTPAVDNQIYGWSAGLSSIQVTPGQKDQDIIFSMEGQNYSQGTALQFYNSVYMRTFDCSAISRVIRELHFEQINDSIFDPNINKLIISTVSSARNNVGLITVNSIEKVKYLEELYFCNFTNLTNLDLSGNLYLQKADLRGNTRLTGVNFPVAAPTTVLRLPAALQSLELDSMANLDTVEIEGQGANLRTVSLKNCKLTNSSPAWILALPESARGQIDLSVSGISWNASVQTVLSFAQFGSVALKGEIVLTDQTITLADVEAIQAIFGRNCFTPSNASGLWIHGQGDATFWTGPNISDGTSTIVEGDSYQYAFVSIGSEAGDVEYMIPNNPLGVTVNELGIVTVPLNGTAGSVVLTANHTTASGTKGYSLRIAIEKETYPTITIEGPASIRGNSASYEATLGGSYNADPEKLSYAWSLGGDIASHFGVTEGPMVDGKPTCTINKTSDYVLSEGTITLEIYRSGRKVAETSMNIVCASDNIAVTRTGNAPIMTAFWNAYGENGSQVATYGQLLSNPNYISKTEAAQFNGTMLNPSGGGSSSIFYAQRANITHFEEFEYFTGVTELPAYLFNGCTKMETLKLPQFLVSIGLNSLVGIAVSELDFPDTLESIGAGGVSNCKNLKRVVLGSSFKTLTQSGFSGCSALEYIEFNGLVTGQYWSFLNCTSLREVHVKGTCNASLSDSRFFQGCESLEILDLSGCISFTAQPLPNLPLKEVWIEKSMTVPESFFNSYTDIDRLIIKSRAALIPDNGLRQARHPFREVVIEDGCTTMIKSGPFVLTADGLDIVYCESHKGTITTPASATRVLVKGLCGLQGITNIVISEGLATLSNSALQGITDLEVISFPSTLSSFGLYTMGECRNVKQMDFHRAAAIEVRPDTWGNFAANTKASGTNVVRVPVNATGYESGRWASVILSASNLNFTLQKVL